MTVSGNTQGGSWYRSWGKRVFDALTASLLLTLLSPLLLVLAVVILITMGAPVFFRQTRGGRGGRPFILTKFRTMLPENDEEAGSRTPEERVTPFGKVMRRFSLDELPELWHVITGEMSLVGPRPLLIEYNDLYSTVQGRRLEVRPGLTGWAQINGRNDVTWSERLDRDVWYVDNLSPSLDMTILIRTIPEVLTGRGVTSETGAFMAEFKGEGSK